MARTSIYYLLIALLNLFLFSKLVFSNSDQENSMTSSTSSIYGTLLQRARRRLEPFYRRRYRTLFQIAVTQMFRQCDRFKAPCPEWSSWSGPRSCSVSCGGGLALERRYCKHKKQFWGCEGPATRSTPCNSQTCPIWSDWKPASQCSRSCGMGQMVLQRNCVKGSTKVSGCVGATHKVMPCNARNACSSEWTSWSSYSDCSHSCGMHGRRTRTRQCHLFFRNAKSLCTGPSFEVQSCNENVMCPLKHSDWSSWSDCDVECGKWTTVQRKRSCLVPPCSKDQLTQTRFCGLEKCNDQVNKTDITRMQREWSTWSPCNASCGEGRQMRALNCSVTKNKDLICEISTTQTRICHRANSCPSWAEWGQWTACKGECANGTGSRVRNRQCLIKRSTVNITTTKPNTDGNATKREISAWFTRTAKIVETSSALPSTTPYYSRNRSDYGYQESSAFPSRSVLSENSTKSDIASELSILESVDVNLCFGGENFSFERKLCEVTPCLPQWEKWSSWSACSVSCGEGYASSTRRCLDSNKSNSSGCKGPFFMYKKCISQACWSEWTEFSPCTTSCGENGKKTRYRTCLGTTTEHPWFHRCNGNDTEVRSCNTQECPVWGSWAFIGRCSVSCGKGGHRFMRRTCLKGKCEGNNVTYSNCNDRPCPEWAKWGAFSCCSTSCGEGVKTRTRECLDGMPGDEGCDGSEEEVSRCNPGRCNETVTVPTSFSCGESLQPAKLRIHGGKTAAERKWPWQVSIQENDCGEDNPCWSHFCGGVLIHPQFVATATHCTESSAKYNKFRHDGPVNMRVVLGTNELNPERRGIRVGVRRIIPYPMYVEANAIYNDIELLKLERPVEINRDIMPICLPGTNAPHEGDNCYVTGWGYSGNSSTLFNHLQEATLPIMSIERCKSLSIDYDQLTDKHMCAGDPATASADTCEGDSGGPLMCQDGRKNWYLSGITSFGFAHCGTPNHVGVYTSVPNYESWIRNTIAAYSHAGC